MKWRRRRSTVKRFAYRLSGKKEKFDAKAEQEEREYLEAVQKHVNACHELDVLKESIAQSERKLQELESVATAHSNAQKELDSLYDSIFQGPTPEYPEEDQAEIPVQQLRQEFAGVQARLSVENQALSILLDADKFMQRAIVDLGQANKANNATGYGMVIVNTDMARVTERNSLSKAECHLSQVEMLVSQAQRAQPAVKEIGNVELKAGQMLGNVIFNDGWNELYVLEEIEKGQKQLKQASDKLKAEVQAARKREDSVKLELAGVKGRLDEARMNLERVRAGTFESIAGGLPSYQV